MGATGPAESGLKTTLSAPVATSGATEKVLAQLQVPANGVAVGDTFKIRMAGLSSSTGTLIFRLRAGALGTIADGQIWISTTSAAQVANAHAGVDLLLVVRAIGAAGAVSADGNAHAGAVMLPTLIGAATAPTVVTTAAWWINLTCVCSSGTFTAQVCSIEEVD